MRLLCATIGIFLTGVAVLPATADTLEMPPAGEQQAIQLEMPAKGMSMRQVEKRFGTPNAKLEPVGDPPITRWKYDEFTVYFEHQYVIHSVLTR